MIKDVNNIFNSLRLGMPAMSKIFISYRRTDSDSVAGRIYDHLLRHFRKDQVFKDVDSIPAGTDFRQHIETAVRSCKVVLAIIGDNWLQAVDKWGNRRLDDPDDFVRMELEIAIRHQIHLIPVLVGKCEIPNAEALPPSLITGGQRDGRNGR